MTPRPSVQQQAVIDYGLRPLRVTAGAGTGKTFTLVRRMAALMVRHGVLPEQILGVTFTNKAAAELAGRIRSAPELSSTPAMGPEHAIDVFTYHGFAAHLLGTYGALVGMDRGTRIITPAAGRQILHRCVLATPFRIVDATHVPTVVRKLVDLAGELSDNLLRPEDILASDPVDEAGARRAELARALVMFEKEKRGLGVRDFGDLTRLAVALVQNPDHRGIVDRVRSQYRCVLLDEYQDTNPAQRELFSTLFGAGRAVTAVGDLDQTIYEWRGASPANFGYFPTSFREADGSESRTLRLSVNRRSGRRILDLANRVRARITGSDPADDLEALEGKPPGSVQVSWLGDAREEAEEIARELRRLHESGMEWSEMAVLFRRNANIELVRQALEEHDIPLQVTDLGGLLKVPEVVELHAWLRLLDDPADSPALARILIGAGYRLGLGDLAPLARWVASRNRNSDGLRFILVEALEQLDSLDLLPDIRGRLERFRDIYRSLLVEAQGAGPSELARSVLARTGGWQDIEAMPTPSNISARLNVHRFLDFTEHWQPLEGSFSLKAFLGHLEMVRDHPDDGLDTVRLAGEEAVTLSTVHQAKGLEWQAVFLPALYETNFPARPRVYADPSRLDACVPAHLRIDPEFRANLDAALDPRTRRDWLRRRHYDQEWRLAYVAVTRAEQHLYLSGAHWYGSPEPLKRPSQPGDLIETARRLEHVTIGRWIPEPPPRPGSLRFPIPEAGPDPVLGTTWERALHEIGSDPDWAASRACRLGVEDLYDQAVEEFQEVLLSLTDPAGGDPEPEPTVISVTGLVTYADCPKRYYWSEVDRLPRRPGPAARRGLELHRRIELHNRGMVPFDDLEPQLYDHTLEEDTERADGSRTGWSAFLESPYADRIPVLVEAPFELRMSESVRIRGRIDAVYGDDEGGWEIVDFKSGRRSGRASSQVQLQAYALAARESGLGAPAPESLKVSFVYLGDGLDVVSQEADSLWMERAGQRVTELVEGIRSEQFQTTPSDACRSCDFLTFCKAGQAHLAARQQER
ncbi:MAG: ATP-dependent helicase [Acidimicrobiia bacterium]|nr:ATP-dependent helicase [Acidimicrobiia bacterium]MYF83888.1 ATP-dependent helicase [Acidimicrobiia bacterium]